MGGSPLGTVIFAKLLQQVKVGRCQASQIILVEIDTDLCIQRKLVVKTAVLANLSDPVHNHGAREDEDVIVVQGVRTHRRNEAAAHDRLLTVQGVTVPRCYGKYVHRIVSNQRTSQGMYTWCFSSTSIASRYSIRYHERFVFLYYDKARNYHPNHRHGQYNALLWCLPPRFSWT